MRKDFTTSAYYYEQIKFGSDTILFFLFSFLQLYYIIFLYYISTLFCKNFLVSYFYLQTNQVFIFVPLFLQRSCILLWWGQRVSNPLGPQDKRFTVSPVSLTDYAPMATPEGLEPSFFCVTGRRRNLWTMGPSGPRSRTRTLDFHLVRVTL